MKTFKMKILLAAFVILFFTYFSSSAAFPAENKYPTKYDNINVDQILKNDRLLKNYMDCVLDKGKCTKEGQELRKHLPDAIATDCSKCSEKQKKMAGKILAHLLQYRRDYWEDLLAKYDPEGNFRRKYEFEED